VTRARATSASARVRDRRSPSSWSGSPSGSAPRAVKARRPAACPSSWRARASCATESARSIGSCDAQEQGRPQDTQRGGQPQQERGDQRSASSQGQEGQSGQQGQAGGGRGDAQRGSEQGRPWQEARELVDDLRREEGLGASTPENAGFNPGISAPGTQAWKQDFAKWDELKKQLEVALEKSETSLAAKLREQEAKDRLSAGATQAVPEQYRRLVDKYYRALAQRKR
jgi:hypothetical protein